MDRSKENSKAAFDRQAAGYDQGACGQHARSLYPLLLAKLARIPFHTALDLGCGTGEMMRLLLEADPGRKLFGLDLSEEMLSVARGKLQGRGVRAIVGGGYICNIAQEMGFLVFPVEVNRFTVKETIHKALSIADTQKYARYSQKNIS